MSYVFVYIISKIYNTVIIDISLSIDQYVIIYLGKLHFVVFFTVFNKKFRFNNEMFRKFYMNRNLLYLNEVN